MSGITYSEQDDSKTRKKVMPMKCPHCSSEWNASSQMTASLKSCPFCRKPLPSAAEGKENLLKSVLCQIASDYGLDALRNGLQMLGYFMDLAPNLKRECRMLKYFVDAGGHTALFNARNAKPTDQPISMAQIVQKMVDESLVAEDTARLVCEAYWAAVTESSIHAKTETVNPNISIPQIDPSNPLSFILPYALEGEEAAQIELAKAFYYGKEIEQDYQQAVYWFKEAAKHKNGEAMNYLGICYEKGRGVDQDYEKAVYWYDRATIYHSVTALYNLGNCYLKGQGVSKNTVEASFYFYEAAEAGNIFAEYAFAEVMYKGEGIRQDYRLAVKWYLKSAEHGNPFAKNRLGECYLYGRGVEQDHKRAVEYFSEVAKSTPIAAYNLGYCYENGLGVRQSVTTAISWYEEAAKSINPEVSGMANQRLGVLGKNAEELW